MSFEVASYGCSVASAFLTVYPEYTDKWVLDSPTGPLQDEPCMYSLFFFVILSSVLHTAYTWGKAETVQIKYDYEEWVCNKVVFMCDFTSNQYMLRQ